MMFAESGTCGENLTWDLTNGVLTISGTGAMNDYSYGVAPWYDNCENISQVVINDGVTSIGDYAFAGCSSLTSVTIPNSVTSIGQYAFYDCRGLTSVTIPNSVTSIGTNIFQDCSSLTSIDVASDNSNYCSVDGVLFNKDKTTLVQYPGGKQGAYTIPNGVTSIGDFAFYVCSGLTSVTVGNSVTSIGEYAFAVCPSLTSINVASDNLNYCSEDGILFNKDKSILIQYPASKNNTEYDIPNSVTSIGECAFFGCSGLTSVTIPNSVTCIGGDAFDGCTGLTSVTIPNSVTSIGDHAFTNCTGLTSLTCMATTPPSMSIDVFYKVDCSQIPLYVPVGSIDAYQTAYQWEDFTNILPIGAEETETTTVKTEPTTNSVEVTWPVVVGAYTYELVIKDKSGNVICTLVFNAQGQLISIAFNAPGRDGVPQQTQGAGFSFTITGLTAGTSYDVTITAKDSNGNTLDTRTSSFTTKGEAPQGIDDINAATKSQKIVRDNQVLILRGDKTYTLTGQEVK
ncbi:MAG: fibronectin type III domain-containing protein [Paludibacteraceae bacterium]|nr:fibronectin type III domain-containing protein [Paludibacteraceae bacterium]